MFPHIPLFASANLAALKKPGSDQIGSDRPDRIGSIGSDRIGLDRSDRIDQTGSEKIDRTGLDRIGTRIGSPIRPQIGLQGFL